MLKDMKLTKLQKLKKWDGEFIYVFKYVCVTCELDPSIYGEYDKKQIKNDLKTLTREIWIDKTYVDFKGTKFEKTFMYEEGWNSLRELVLDTQFGKKSDEYQSALMYLAYKEIIIGYLYMVLKDLGWDISGINFSISEEIPFIIEYYPDTAEEWKRYPGKWQTWPENN